jgi:hypothetical protein
VPLNVAFFNPDLIEQLQLGLRIIKQRFGVDYRRTLAEIIALNTDIPLADLNDNVFLLADASSAEPDDSLATVRPTMVTQFRVAVSWATC